MLMKLYKINDDKNVINKTLGTSTDIQVNFKHDIDEVRPQIVLVNDDNFTFTGFNYCHVEVLNRYYFIENVERLNSRMMRLNCLVDVLETYKDEILNSTCEMNRGIKTGDYLDVSIDSVVNPTITKHISNAGFVGEETLIMTTMGVADNG